MSEDPKEAFTKNAEEFDELMVKMLNRNEQQQQEIDELKFTLDKAKDINSIIETENDELKAYVERLHSITKEWKGLAINDARTLIAFIELANSTPAQSLIHIKAQVEEETMVDCEKELESYWDGYGANLIRNKARKYKKQSDEGGE